MRVYEGLTEKTNGHCIENEEGRHDTHYPLSPMLKNNCKFFRFLWTRTRLTIAEYEGDVETQTLDRTNSQMSTQRTNWSEIM